MSSRRRGRRKLLPRSESGGGWVSPAPRIAQADPAARSPPAGLSQLAPPAEGWETRCGEVPALLRRCAVPVGRGPGASHPPRGSVNKLLPTVPKHPMQNLWHAIKPEFLAEGVASVSQDRRRGAGSTPVSTAPLPPTPALGSPMAPLVRSLSAAPLCGARMVLKLVLHRPSTRRRPALGGGRAVPRWCVALRDWPPLKAMRTSTVPKHPMQNLWHAIKPEFLAEGVASVSQDRRRGAGSTPVSTAPLPPTPALGSPIVLSSAPRSRPSLARSSYAPGPDGVGCTVMAGRVMGLAALKGQAYFDGPQAPDAESLACNIA